MSDTPNILWICTDQQRFDTLGCYGNPYVHTPNLDRLAEQSILFEYAFSQSPVCTPSRSSFLTGRYPRTTRCRQNGQSIPSDEIPVTKLLHDAGYVCGLSGKLHISVCNPSACHGTERRKLVAAHGTGGGELYDLETDPTETHNQWNNPNYTTVRLDLMTRLADRMAWTVDPLPPREAGF